MDDPDDELAVYCRSRVGEMLQDKWHLDRMLGLGGMAAVYAASHRNGTTAALKVLHRQYAAVPSFRERFLREAYIANKAGHDGVVKVRDDAVDQHGSPFLVMELLEGESVADRADRLGGWLPMVDAIWVAQELLSVLEAAHRAGIVHRDIKPDNLFWTTEGKLKVLDFGIARLREEAPTKRTQTGMVFGTPGYMAPEQALGRWADVDARTDLWAVGATIFNLITGESVHEGDTDNERLVNAATRPARSLGRAFPSAPQGLVDVVDRALSFDQSQRYANAEAMRLELDHVVATSGGAVRTSEPGQPPRSAQAGAPSATSRESTAPPPLARDPAAKPKPKRRAPDPSELDELIADASPRMIAALRDTFVLLEKAMKARLQYGSGHKETERRAAVAFEHVAANLLALDEPLVWHVRAYGFTAEDELLWEPKPPLDQVAYRLFADGIRAFALVPGLTAPQLAELLQIFIADKKSDVTAEDNLATLLWDARLEHVVYEEADSFAEGDQAERAAFERLRQEVLIVATLETPDQLEDCWRARRAPTKSDDVPARQRALLGAVVGGSAAAAQASSMRPDTGVPKVELLSLDEAAKALLKARLEVGLEVVGERFAGAAASAYVLASRHQVAGLVGGSLRAAVDGFAGPRAAADAVALVARLSRGVEQAAKASEREALVASLVTAIVSPRTLEAAVKAAALPGGAAQFVAPLRSILSRLDGTHVAPVAATVATLDPGELREALLAYVTRHAAGHEGEIAATFATGHLDGSIALLKVLTQLKTPEARAAAEVAGRSPHPIVRIEAFAHLEGASGVGIRLALKAMLEDWDPAVRLAALRSIGQYRVKAAGPAIVLRVKSPEFDALPLEERREALSALFELMSSRAEVVCVDLLGETRLLENEAHEQTRQAAAELLGRRGFAADTRTALETASRARWRNSDRVRLAAAAALALFDERASRGSLPPPSLSPPDASGRSSSSVPPRAARSSIPPSGKS